MADRGFGVKQLNLIGPSGTPTIESPNNLNINAIKVAISTDISIGGQVVSDIIVGSGKSVGIGTTFLPAKVTINGDVRIFDNTTIQKVSDIYSSGSTVGTTLTCDFNNGPITRTTSVNIATINIANVPTTSDRILNYTVLLNAASTVSNLASISFQINGSSMTTGGNTLRWLNSLSPSGTSAAYYLFGFSILRVGSVWETLGVFATYG